jgi:hypothetical protein
MATPNLALPELSQSQSSKEITHNQALRIIDVLVPVAVVQDKDLTTPPSPIAGNLYLVAPNATGSWAGQDNKLAYSDGASWYFITPKNKWTAYVADELKTYRYNGTSWLVESVGNVNGASLSTDNAWPRFDGTSGKTLQNGLWVEDDAGNVTAGGNLNLADKTLQRANIKDYAEEAFNLGNLSGDVMLDFENGNFQYGVLTGDVTLSIVNPPASDKVGSMTLELKQDASGNRAVTFPPNFQYAAGNAPILSPSANAVDVLVFYTRDGGTSYHCGTFGLSFA